MFQRNGKHYLTDNPPTQLGNIVEDLIMPRRYTLENLTEDRGRKILQNHTILNFPEFEKYYIEYFIFESKIRQIIKGPKRERAIGFACAFANEIMYHLMKDEGVSYEDAFNLVPNRIVANGVRDFIHLEDTKYNVFIGMNLDRLDEKRDKLEYEKNLKVYLFYRDWSTWLRDYAREVAKKMRFRFY